MSEDQLGSLPSKQSKHSSRHVAFSETSSAPPSRKGDQGIILPPDLDSEPTKRFRSKAYACCAWGCLFIFTFVLLALIFGFIFISIFHSYLPEIRVRRFNATRLEFFNQKQNAGVKGRVDLLMEFTNKNDKTELKFGVFKISASSARVNLGKAEFHSFSQAQKSKKSMNTTIGVNQVGVDKDDAEQLKQDIKNHEVILKLSVAGSVSFPIGGVMMKQIPIVAACDCKQTEVDFGYNTKCAFQIFHS